MSQGDSLNMATGKPIRVFITDDSESMRLSLYRLLNVFGDLEWVGESSNGLDLIEECHHLCPDVVLIDVALPHVDVAQITRSIRGCFPQTQVIGMVGFEDKAFAESILRAGAIQCVSKNASIYLIADALRQAACTSERYYLVNQTGSASTLR